jgi:PncC family amidohydrolase
MLWYRCFLEQEGYPLGVCHDMLDHSQRIESQIGQRLAGSGRTLATAESCSGGLVAHLLTNVAGSSVYFLGGVVAYSNAAKVALLGVEAGTLDAHGAVSELVARQMAEGARRRFGADYAMACTGIAGPSGGSPDKPVGLVYTAVAGPEGTEVLRNQFEGSREEIKHETAKAVLRMLLERLA